MATHIPPPFPPGSIEDIAKVVGELYRGSELTRLLTQVNLPDPLGPSMTKWKRLAAAIQDKQATSGNGGAIVGLIHAAMAPERTLSRRAEAAVARDELNQVLSLSGYCVKENGRIAAATRATTDTEAAAARSERLHKLLSDRGAHQDVLRYCRPELLRTDFYEAVFEATKGLGHRLRSMSGGTDEDGPKLVETVPEGADPLILLNERANRSQRDEQPGVALLMKGVFAAFRNPTRHPSPLTLEQSKGTLSRPREELSIPVDRLVSGDLRSS